MPGAAARQPGHLGVHGRDIDAHAVQMRDRRASHGLFIKDPKGTAQHGFALQEHVAVDIQFIDQGKILVDRLYAEAARVRDGTQRYGRAVDIELSARGFEEAGDDFHQRGLAGAVVTEQSKHLSASQPQIDVAQRRHWPKRFAMCSARSNSPETASCSIIRLPGRAAG